MVPAALAATFAAPTGPPRWFISPKPTIINEGDPCAVEIYCINPLPGARLRLWWYGIVKASNWKRDWHVALEEAAALVGCTYERDAGSKVLGSQSGSIVIGPNYAGGTLVATNASRKNRKNDGALNPDGSPPSRTVSMSIDAATTTGSVKFVGGFAINVRDTSRTPAGQPSIRLKVFAADGVSDPKTVYDEGESFQVALLTENMVPETEIKFYIANIGQSRFTPSFRTAAAAAIQAAGCDYTVSKFPTPPGETYYQGATAIFTDGYDDANPIRVPMTVKQDDIDQGAQPADFIAEIVKEGDLADFPTVVDKGTWASTVTYSYGNTVVWLDDGGNYVYTAGTSSKGNAPSSVDFWRPWQKTIVYSGSATRNVRDVPPRYWEIRATTNGSTIRYALHVPIKTGGSASVVMTSAGAVPPGYDAALAAAIAAHPETVTTDGTRIYAQATTLSSAELVWTVPHPAQPGKHTLRLSDRQGPGWIVIEDAVVYLTAPTLPASPSFITGVNICGGEFGRKESTGFDRYGINYRYPAYPDRETARRYQSMDYYWRKGARVLRLPVLWGRIQPEPFGPLFGEAPPTSATDRADMWRIADVIRYWTQVLGGYVIIDVHNFGNGPQGGKVRYDFDQAENAVPIAALSDLWVKLANRFIDNPKVWLGFMNEPNGATHNATRNRDNMQAVTNAVRARTNSLAKLFIAGCDYSSAANWVANGNAAALESYYDPARNAVFEAHCYFDADASGTKAACVSNSRSRLVSATTWARANGVKLLLGEFGAGNPAVNGQQICGVEMPGALAYMKANKDAWYGWTAYFGGDMWGAAFPFTIDPANYTTADDNGQMTMLLPYFETVPAIPA